MFSHLNRELKKLGCKSIASVYDSAEFEVPISKAAEVAEICYYYFNEYPQTIFPWLGLSIGCEGEIGLSWGSAIGIHRGVSQEECESILNKMKK